MLVGGGATLTKEYILCHSYRLSPSNQVSLTIFELNFYFSQYGKNTLPFCSILAFIAIPQPMASDLQTGRHGRANMRV